MKSLKRAFRLICFLLLILLAALGVGISGAVTIPISHKKEDETIQIELVESIKEK